MGFGRYCWLESSSNGLWLELIEPTTPGPGMDILEKVGPDAIVEANFEALGSDYFKAIDIMDTKGIKMLAMDGSPLTDHGCTYEGVKAWKKRLKRANILLIGRPKIPEVQLSRSTHENWIMKPIY